MSVIGKGYDRFPSLSVLVNLMLFCCLWCNAGTSCDKHFISKVSQLAGGSGAKF